MKVGLFFGTFNPIHVGHLVIANAVLQQQKLDQLWFVVTPHNPHKDKNTLLADYHRLNMVKIAIDNSPQFKASDVEFALEQPNYTVKTLAVLKEAYPEATFSLIMGEDNLRSFHKWYNYEYILEHHHIYVYPRVLTMQELAQEKIEQTSNEFQAHPNVHFLQDIPVMKISSSYIRHQIQAGQDVRYLLTEPVFNYVDEMNFYRKSPVN
jgi:nicotinate-nucleotide adenylyltransferase